MSIRADHKAALAEIIFAEYCCDSEGAVAHAIDAWYADSAIDGKEYDADKHAQADAIVGHDIYWQ